MSESRMLREIRDELRDLEAGVFAESVRALAEVAERLHRIQEEQQRNMPQVWMTHKMCAVYLGRSEHALQRMVKSGEIPVHKIGGQNMYHRREVDEAGLRL